MDSFATFHVLNCDEKTLKHQLHNIVSSKIKYLFEGNSLPKADEELYNTDKEMVNILQFAKELKERQKVLSFDSAENPEEVKLSASFIKMILSYKPKPEYYNYINNDGSISVFSDNISFANAAELVLPLDFYKSAVIICGCYKTELMYFHIAKNNEIMNSIIYGVDLRKYGLEQSIIDYDTFAKYFNCDKTDYSILLSDILENKISALEVCDRLEKITNLPLNPNGETMLYLQKRHKMKRYKITNK